MGEKLKISCHDFLNGFSPAYVDNTIDAVDPVAREQLENHKNR